MNANTSINNKQLMEKLNLITTRLGSYVQKGKPFTYKVVYDLLEGLFDERVKFENHIAGYAYAFFKDEQLVIEVHDDSNLEKVQVSIKFDQQHKMFFDYRFDRPQAFLSEIFTYMTQIYS